MSETAWGKVGQHSPMSWYPLILSDPSPSLLPSFLLFICSPVHSPHCSSFPLSSSCPCHRTCRPVSCPWCPHLLSPPIHPTSSCLWWQCWVVVVLWWPALALVVAPHFHLVSLWGWGWVVCRSVFLGLGTHQLHEKEGKNLQEMSALISPQPLFPLPMSFVLLSLLSSPRLL
jgi:hypothetical protein